MYTDKWSRIRFARTVLKCASNLPSAKVISGLLNEFVEEERQATRVRILEDIIAVQLDDLRKFASERHDDLVAELRLELFGAVSNMEMIGEGHC